MSEITGQLLPQKLQNIGDTRKNQTSPLKWTRSSGDTFVRLAVASMLRSVTNERLDGGTILSFRMTSITIVSYYWWYLFFLYDIQWHPETRLPGYYLLLESFGPSYFGRVGNYKKFMEQYRRTFNYAKEKQLVVDTVSNF